MRKRAVVIGSFGALRHQAATTAGPSPRRKERRRGSIGTPGVSAYGGYGGGAPGGPDRAMAPYRTAPGIPQNPALGEAAGRGLTDTAAGSPERTRARRPFTGLPAHLAPSSHHRP
ncbi:hypothetical protein HEK616_66410 [Streptomyces nigrescens]|uniref:Uncharacterized protein n=1 Tax=Streptomyces nigrescens TaxID=1920 RepID=A0ABN6R404_STRNI|nr:hypothetical protein HEK616_66410 [Streptomyces nigrescens]